MTTIELFPLQNKTEMNSTAVIADEFHNSVGYKISLREMLTGTDEYYQISSGLMISDNRSSEREQKQRQTRIMGSMRRESKAANPPQHSTDRIIIPFHRVAPQKFPNFLWRTDSDLSKIDFR